MFSFLKFSRRYRNTGPTSRQRWLLAKLSPPRHSVSRANAPCLESLEARIVLSSVTVVSHGFTVPGGGILDEMGEGLFNYWSTQGSAGLYIYEPATGDLGLLNGNALGTAENKIIVFDWEEESNENAPGFDEAAGDVLYAMLQEHDLVASDYLHLIGHSRGAIVVSEAAQRLLANGLTVNQLTLLDHENGESTVFPILAAAGDPFAWNGIGFVDNYYGMGSSFPIIGAQQGAEVAGAHNWELPDLGHTEIREWYQNSITATINGTAGAEGFRWRAAPQDQATASIQGSRTPLAAVPDIVNGDFSYGHGSINSVFEFSGWAFQGGGGDADVENGVLDLSFAEATRTHNRMYFPDDATCLSFDLFVPDQSDNDTFRVLIGDEEIGTFNLAPSDPANPEPYFSRFETVGVPIPDRFRGEVDTLTVEVSAPGAINVVDSQVQIDNLEFGAACGVTIMTVIDRSGSMSGTKIEEARSAASLFVDFLRTGDTIGIASYSTSGSVDFPPETITSSDVRMRAQAAIASIGASGSTSIGAGIQVADSELDSSELADDPARAIIIMSDGRQNTDPDPMTVIDTEVDNDIRVFTIGFGSDADNALLAQLAAKRNGQFYFAPNGPQLQQIYTQLLGEIAQEQRALNVNGDILPGETKTAEFLLDPTVGSTTIGLNWTGSDLDLELVAPDGSVITHAEAALDPNVELFEGDTFESIRLTRPMIGMWTVRVIAVDVPVEGEPYNLFVTTDSDVKSEVMILDPGTSETKLNFQTGDEAVIQLSLTDGQPVVGATVVATITSSSDGSQSVMLFDDGTHDDGAANDGVYGNRVTIQRPGALELDVQAIGTTNGGFQTESVELASLFATGELMISTGSIHGRKFNDLNANGVRESGEPWMNGWTIRLLDSNGNLVDEQFTMDVDLNEDGTIDPETETGWYTFSDVAAGDYTVEELMQAPQGQNGSSDPIAVAALDLDTRYEFEPTGNDFEDWGGLGEKWFYGSGGWFYIVPTGGVFQWNGSPSTNLSGTSVGVLTPAYHADPALLVDAPEVNGSEWEQTAPFSGLARTAYELDQAEELKRTGNLFRNWGGLDEIWLLGRDRWFYVTPDGDVFKWDGSGRGNLSGDRVAELSPAYHQDPGLLYDASGPGGYQVTVGADERVEGLDFGNHLAGPELDFAGSGDITLRVSNGSLFLIGDSDDNGVHFHINDDGWVTLAGLGETTLSGQSSHVFEGWTSIPGHVTIRLRGGNDAVVFQHVQVTGHLDVNLDGGDNYFFAENVNVRRNFKYRGSTGSDTIGLRESEIVGNAVVRTDGGNDTVLVDTSVFRSNALMSTGSSNDFVHVRHSHFNGAATVLMDGGDDILAVTGNNSFENRVRAWGGSRSDAALFESGSSFARTPVITGFEDDSLSDLDSILDDIMEELSDVGLGSL